MGKNSVAKGGGFFCDQGSQILVEHLNPEISGDRFKIKRHAVRKGLKDAFDGIAHRKDFYGYAVGEAISSFFDRIDRMDSGDEAESEGRGHGDGAVRG